MTDRTLSMISSMQSANCQGERACMFGQLSGKSLSASVGEEPLIRAAKAEAYLLDHAPMAMLHGELITGSLIAFCPVAAGTNMQATIKTDFIWPDMGIFAPDYELLLKIGLSGLDEALRELADADSDTAYRAQRISVQAVQRFILRYANTVSAQSNRTDGARRQELSLMAQSLRRLATSAAHSFYEALQLIHIVHAALRITGHRPSFGRLDSLLIKFYSADIGSGALTEAGALELIECFIIKQNEPGLNIGAAITLGGTNDDNPLSALFLKAAWNLRLPNPVFALRVSSESSPQVLESAAVLAAVRADSLVIINDDVYVENLIRLKHPYSAALSYALLDTSLVGVPGRSHLYKCDAPISFNDMLSGVLLKYSSGALALESFEQFTDAFEAELRSAVTSCWLNTFERSIDERKRPESPLVQVLIPGGTASREIMARGFVEAADSICSIKKWVYDKRDIRLTMLDGAHLHSFEERVQLELLLRSAPKLGDGSADSNEVASALLSAFTEAVIGLNSPDQRTAYISSVKSVGSVDSDAPYALAPCTEPRNLTGGAPLTINIFEGAEAVTLVELIRAHIASGVAMIDFERKYDT